MDRARKSDLDLELDRFAQRLPDRAARFVRWISGPSCIWIRIPAALALIGGGIVGFLPILGFWMVPLGLVLLSKDVPFLRPPMARLLAWINRKWPARGAASQPSVSRR